MDTTEEMKKAGFVYITPCKVDKSSPKYLRQKKELCDHLLKNSCSIDVRDLDNEEDH